jgi:hypothetical protein
MDLLSFSLGRNNGKLRKLEEKINKKIYVLNLLAGHTCIAADKCLAKAVEVDDTVKIWNGPNQEFRCYAASISVAFPTVYISQRRNTEILRSKKTKKEIFALLDASLPKDAEVVRIHSSGDFYSLVYFDAWLDIARKHSKIIFYAYTKSLSFWVRRINDIPKNMILTASWGGKLDNLIDKHSLRSARVIYSEQEAKDLKLDIDYNDFSAYNPKKRNKSFGLMIHGIQSPSTLGGTAMRQLNRLKKK